MPILNWIGKNKVINYHLDVPYRILDKKYTHNTTDSENKIIHGDNLEALQSLLPEYEGPINCIYIEPPYYTGNEGWVYNVNDSKIKKWLGEVVGNVSEDLIRHDKWLCMMYPRLELLHRLLASDGAIFISIDDNEQANLRLMCDDFFGRSNFVCNLAWQKKYGPANDASYISDTHEFIIVYTKNKVLWRPNTVSRTSKQLKAFKNPDNDPRELWRASDLSARTYSESTDYVITGPTGLHFKPPKSRSWIVTQERYCESVKNNRITFNLNGTGRPMQKRFLSEVEEEIPPQTWWNRDFAEDNNIARYKMKATFPSDPFDTPKPASLVYRILIISSNKDSITLDSFAGLRTTAHAVLKLNKEDGGNRKFILVEMEDYANDITAERVKRVIAGYREGKNKVLGTEGNFSFYELGQPMFLENDYLNEELSLTKIHRYIWYTETASKFEE